MRNVNTPTIATPVDPSGVTTDATPAPGTHRWHARIEGVNRKTGGKVLLNLFTHRKTEVSARVRIEQLAEYEGIEINTLHVSAVTF